MSLSCTFDEMLMLSLISKIQRGQVTEHIRFGIIYHECTSTHVYQSAHEIWNA